MGGGAIQWAISRPVSVTVGVILVVMFGLLSVATLPIQLTPDVTVPTVTVTTNWPGATPQEVETDILEVGDSISYSSSIPHWYRNPGPEPVTALWVVTPPMFQETHRPSNRKTTDI